MRRKDKQIEDQDVIHDILQCNTVCRIALSDGNMPYVIPMNYGYHEQKIYLHSAKEGRKIDIIKKNNAVCFEITDSIEMVTSDTACGYSTKYRSVIGHGKAFPVTDTDKKVEALKIIMKQHTGSVDWDFKESILDKICVFEISIESITGKQSGM